MLTKEFKIEGNIIFETQSEIQLQSASGLN